MSAQARRVDLSAGWSLRLHSDSAEVPADVRAGLPVPATVPGCVHTDLLAAGLIADPYIDRHADDDREAALAWIGRATWVYERTLPAGEPGPAVLVFDGLDTVATVTLDDEVVARTHNMHRRYEVPVMLHSGVTRLAVRFDPAEEFAQQEAARVGALPHQYPLPFNHIRKMACNFGWDWGPTLVTAGIWRPVTLIRGPHLRQVRPAVTLAGDVGTVRVEAAIHVGETVTGPVEVVVAVAGQFAAQPVVDGAATVLVQVPQPAVWWPRGLGDQPLYDLVVTLRGPGGETLDEWRERIGFRAVRLDTSTDEPGSRFAIVVNDVPVAVHGANWIPDDCFPSRVTPARLRERIDQAVGARVNLLRVWGGGTYESRDFYAICDELGVLVWQDFLFACAAYPEDEQTVAQVRAEARDNVARLMPHPSLVLWNGNNECFWGILDWGWPSVGDRAWGSGLWLQVLPAVVAQVDPTRPYWPGSPWSGSLHRHPNEDGHGTRHIWDVWNELDYTAYRTMRPRFAAEFGWQGPPAWSTLTAAVRDEPLTPAAAGMLRRQKAEDGAAKLDRGIARHFPEPSTMDDWHWAAQLTQARAVRLGVEHFRSLWPHCTGTIVWQLNDCWPVTSWAAIDGFGHRKPLWHALRAAHAPRLLTIQPRGAGLALVAVNDTREAWSGPVTVRRETFDGKHLRSVELTLAVPPHGAVTHELPTLLAAPDDPTAELLVADPGLGQRAWWFFATDRELAYPPAVLDVSTAVEDAQLVVSVQAQTLVRDLMIFPDRLDPAGQVDDGLLTLLPGERAVLRVTGVDASAAEALAVAPVLRTAADLR